MRIHNEYKIRVLGRIAVQAQASQGDIDVR